MLGLQSKRPPSAIALVALASAMVSAPAYLADAAECGDPQTPCVIASGEYFYTTPVSPPGPNGYPVVIMLHGWASSGTAAVQNPKTVEPVTSRGYLFVAPNALHAASGKRDWSVRDGQPPRRDELAFLNDVLADLDKRHAVNRAKVLLAGFSRGGSMVWNIACETPNAFAAYAPVAGGFWDPLPVSCAGPVRLFHTHGWGDATVPLEGRLLGTSGLVQGNIFSGLGIWRDTNLCASRPAEKRFARNERWLRSWDTCAPDAELRLILHPGGHSIPADWADGALDWFEAGVPRNDEIAGQR
ncbi:MAG: polyhydroxybutyrate depolymerase [Alphaproteobacteria bacterium]|nr:polyhydroxybutyrate depolymerase [Alphaproteobacteria bacterium]